MIERESLRVYRLSVFVLAVEWIFFGSMHFTEFELTKQQIPGWIRESWHTAVAVLTGMIEVTTGILILMRRTRKVAAWTTLGLLAVFLPSIYEMLAHPDVPYFGVVTNFVRVLLVPNHVFMALCAIYLLKWPDRPDEQVPLTGEGRASAFDAFFTGERATLMVALIMLAANIAGFLVVMSSRLGSTTAYLWALMCLAVGGLVGFLFGVPRVSLGEKTAVTHRPNSNIELLSDWLTKIIVGVGLLQFHKLGAFLDKSSRALGAALSTTDAVRASAFALAIIVYFFVAGVIQGYLLTRMFLSERFEELETAPLEVAVVTQDVTTA